MNLSSEQSHDRLAANDHGVLATLHAARGADLVPVVYTVVDGHVGVPVDLVKPKASARLQRERNLESDPRATLLVEHWDRLEEVLGQRIVKVANRTRPRWPCSTCRLGCWGSTTCNTARGCGAW